MQQAAVMATVRVSNLSRKTHGSGIIIGSKPPHVYILTAHHIVDRADLLRVAVFSSTTYPRPERVYHTVSIVAQAADTRDLALIRVTTKDRLPNPLPFCPVHMLPDQ